MNATKIAVIGLLVIGMAIAGAPAATAESGPEDCSIGYHEGVKLGSLDTGEICVVAKGNSTGGQ